LAHNPLPEFLRFVRKAVQPRPGDGSARTPRVPLGNDLPEDGGITGQMPRPTMELRTGEDDPVLSPQEPQPQDSRLLHQVAAEVANAYADRSATPRVMPAVGVPAVGVTQPDVSVATVPIPVESPMVSRADSNRAIQEAGLRPEKKLFNSGDRRTDLEERREALEDYEPQKRGWWTNMKSNFLPALMGGLRTGNPVGALGGVAGGAAVAAVDRKGADRRWKNQELGEVSGQIAGEDKRDDAAVRRQQVATATAKTAIEARNAANKPAQDAAKDAADRLVSQFNSLKNFDPEGTDPQTVAMMRQAERLGLALPKKEEGDRFTLGMAPDGTGIVLNTREGTTRNVGNYAKPQPVKAADLPDTLFGIPDEKMIADEARAAVAPDLKNRRVTDYAARHYQTPDGQFDEAKAWADIEDQVVRPSEIWENVTEQDDQRLAGRATRFARSTSPSGRRLTSSGWPCRG
jgi:hypothetical protein